MLHCRGGLGRTETIAARLLVEFGMDPHEAIRRVRAAWTGASSSRSEGKGQERPAAIARFIVSFTVLLPTQQVLAVSRRLWLHDQTRRSISLVFRMVTLSLGITPSLYSIKEGRIPVGVTPRLHSHFTLAGLLRNRGRIQIGMLAAFPSERWPLSRRNGGRIRPEYAPFRTSVISRQK